MRQLGRVETIRRVLLVDDNVDAAEMLGELLGLLGHEVTIAHDGQAALELGERGPFDIALVDLGLPDMSGHELGARLKAMAPETSVVIVSGYAQEEDKAKSFALGFQGHLAKPVSVDVLGDVIARSARV